MNLQHQTCLELVLEHLALLIADHIAEVIDRAGQISGFSVKNQKSVFHYAAPPSASLVDMAS